MLSVALSFAVIGCLRSGALGNPNAQGGNNPNVSSEPAGTSATLASSLASGNLASIEKSSCPYCEWSGKNASAGKSVSARKSGAGAVGSSEAAFGCFLTQLSQMFESAPATDFLAAFGEPAIHVQADILDKTNPNALCTKLSSMHPKKFYLQFPQLPFNNYRFRHNNFAHFLQEMLKRAKANGIPISRVQDDLYALDTQLSRLLELLTIARADASFQFTIPKELCQVSKDILVKKIDLEGFNGGLGSLRIFVNLLHSYVAGLDPARIANSNGTINEAAFVADANGVGGDNKKFVELIASRGDISSLQPLLQGSLDSLIALLDGVHSKSDSEVFGDLLQLRQYRNFFSDVKKASKDLRSSLAHSGVLTPLTELGHPSVKVDVGRFMSSLPDPKTVNNADPFVEDHANHIRGVANFWKTLLSGIASF